MKKKTNPKKKNISIHRSLAVNLKNKPQIMWLFYVLKSTIIQIIVYFDTIIQTRTSDKCPHGNKNKSHRYWLFINKINNTCKINQKIRNADSIMIPSFN